MAVFVIAVTRHSSIAVVVAIRSEWPFMQPSPKNWPGLQNADHGFLALLGYDNNLDPTFLNIEDRICHVALGEDDLILAKFKDGLPFAHLGEKLLGIEYCLIGIGWHVRFRPRAVGRLPYHSGRRQSEVKVPHDEGIAGMSEGDFSPEQSRAFMEMTREIEAAEEHSAADS